MKLKDLKRDPTKLRKATLCHFTKDGKVLLAMKKRGFGVGKWNGVGGKVKDGESIEEAAIRETEEEIGVSIRKFTKVAVMDFYFQSRSDWDQSVSVFLIGDFGGNPKETEEMKPEWFAVNNIPYDMMWPSDRKWLPIILSGKRFIASFLLDDDGKIVDQALKEVEKL